MSYREIDDVCETWDQTTGSYIQFMTR